MREGEYWGDQARKARRRLARWFLAPLAVAVLGLGALIAYKQHVFSSYLQLVFFTQSANGITRGMPVTLSGIQIGEVGGIRLVQPAVGRDERVEVTLSVLAEYAPHLPHDSVARITRDGLIGRSAIDLTPGKAGRTVAQRELIAFQRAPGLGELAENLDAKLTPLMGDTRALIADLRALTPDLKENLAASRQLLEHSRSVGETVRGTLQQATHTLRSGETTLVQVGKEVNATLQGTQTSLEDVRQSATRSLETATQSLSTADRLLEQSRQTLQETRQQVGRTLQETERVVTQVGEITDGARHSWPFSLWVAPPQRRTLGVDSQELQRGIP